VRVAQPTWPRGCPDDGGEAAVRLDVAIGGTASDLLWPADRFDAAVSVNNIQEWRSLRDDLAELWRVLRPGGCLVVAVHAFLAKSAQDRGNRDRPWEEHIVGALRGAGFSEVAGWKGRALSGRALYFRARKLSAA
jgi:SAM-dependent methyltransferase